MARCHGWCNILIYLPEIGLSAEDMGSWGFNFEDKEIIAQ
jgi:hypothetical protein